MKQLKRIAGSIVAKLGWIPVLLFFIFYALVINVDKVHKEFDDEGASPEND